VCEAAACVLLCFSSAAAWGVCSAVLFGLASAGWVGCRPSGAS
jgi:hypothetical protein